MPQMYRRGTTWMTAQQAREYDKRGGITVVEPTKEVVQEAVIEDKKIIVEDVISGEKMEVTESEINNAELIEAVPMTEVLAKEEKEYAKELEKALKKAAKKKGLSKKRTGAYVYGTLAKIKKSKKK